MHWRMVIRVDLEIVWKTILRDLPVLAEQVEGLAAEVACDSTDKPRP